MKPLDPKVLDRILGRLPLADALELSAALEPPWRARQRRLKLGTILSGRNSQAPLGPA